MMKRTSGKEEPARSEEVQRELESEALSLSPETLENQATSTSSTLSEILEQQATSYTRHWGINE
jgi:hypothetical protein